MDAKMQGRKHVYKVEHGTGKRVSCRLSGHHALKGKHMPLHVSLTADCTQAAQDFLALVCNPQVELYILNWIQSLCSTCSHRLKKSF